MAKEDIISGKLKELKVAADTAYRRWLVLYREPGSLTNAAKRSAMLSARQEYQDALAAYVFLLRARKPRKPA